MRVSSTKIATFFVVLLIMGWFLYPRQLFMAFIYEGLADLKTAEAQYLKYLEKRPFHKFATLRLSNLYLRMGRPEAATPYLKNLFAHRYLDWEVARLYLNHLAQFGTVEEQLEAQRRVAKNFLGSRFVHPTEQEQLLNAAISNAYWMGDTSSIRGLLNDLITITKNKGPYEEKLYQLNLVEKNTSAVITYLQNTLATHPRNEPLRFELYYVYWDNERMKEALNLLNEGITLNPNSTDLLKTRINHYEKTQNYQKAIEDTMHLIHILSESPKNNTSVLLK